MIVYNVVIQPEFLGKLANDLTTNLRLLTGGQETLHLGIPIAQLKFEAAPSKEELNTLKEKLTQELKLPVWIELQKEPITV